MDDMMRSMPDLPGSKAWRDELKQITDAQILDRVDVVDELCSQRGIEGSELRFINSNKRTRDQDYPY